MLFGRLVPNIDVSHLDAQLLDENGRLRLRPAADYRAIPPLELQVWCTKRARYQIVTLEMVEWLKGVIAGKSALEVGAGMGDLGFHLGIPMTDAGIQSSPELAGYYRSLGQAMTTPPDDVERLGAEEAVAKYKPQVLIACWLTQKWHDGDSEKIGGSVYGPEEEALLRSCESYIHFGNELSHRGKRIRKFAHEKLRFPWLVTRSAEQKKNVVYRWSGV